MLDITSDVGKKRVKAYKNTVDAVRDLLNYLARDGEKVDYRQLERKQIEAGVPPEEVLSSDMLRAFHRGRVRTFSADRAESFCRVMGVQVFIANPTIPEGFVATTMPTAADDDEGTPEAIKTTKKSTKNKRA